MPRGWFGVGIFVSVSRDHWGESAYAHMTRLICAFLQGLSLKSGSLIAGDNGAGGLPQAHLMTGTLTAAGDNRLVTI